MQGGTVSKPNNLVVDVQSSHQPGMVYVMLSRVCSLQQLHILEEMDPDKIRVDEKVMKEAKRMSTVSLNNNPGSWANPKVEGLRVASLNVSSLRKHVEDVKGDPVLMQSDVLFVQETWLEVSEEEEDRYQLEGYQAYFTSPGRGKGIATFVKEGVNILSISKFEAPNIQLAKVEMEKLDLVSIYRSRDEPLHQVTQLLQNFLHPKKDTLVVGDVNICATRTNDLGKYLQQKGFRQLVTLPTHIRGGIY